MAKAVTNKTTRARQGKGTKGADNKDDNRNNKNLTNLTLIGMTLMSKKSNTVMLMLIMRVMVLIAASDYLAATGAIELSLDEGREGEGIDSQGEESDYEYSGWARHLHGHDTWV
jgi:hypothetical protein